MHKEAHLLDGVCQVRMSQREVLECASKAPVHGRISNRGTSGGRKLGMSVNRCRRRVTLSHAGTLKELNDVLSL